MRPKGTQEGAAGSALAEQAGACAKGSASASADGQRRAPEAWADARTTVMLRNVPSNYTRAMLLGMLDDEGFSGCYDFLYLPVDFNSGACLGDARGVPAPSLPLSWPPWDRQEHPPEPGAKRGLGGRSGRRGPGWCAAGAGARHRAFGWQGRAPARGRLVGGPAQGVVAVWESDSRPEGVVERRASRGNLCG